MKTTLLIASAILLSQAAAGQATNYPNGSTVADFTVTDTDGITHSLHAITAQGKYVMLDFFFAACPPCQATQPYYNQLHETYGCNGSDLFVMSLNNGNDNDAQVIAYENTYGGSYAHSPAVSNQGGGPAVTATFGVGAFPTYVLIGPNNVMISNDIWPIDDMSTFEAAFPAGSNIQPAACIVGITENGNSLLSRVYPSPSNGLLTVELKTINGGRTIIEVIDVAGRKVHQQDMGSRLNGVIDLGSLNDGNYILRVAQDNNIVGHHNIMIAH